MKNLLKLKSLWLLPKLTTLKLLVFGIFIYAGSCLAESTNKVPVHINANKLEYNSDEKVIYLKGNVVVKHVEGTLMADNATVYMVADKKEDTTNKKDKSKKKKENKMGSIKRIVAVGNVRMSGSDGMTISDKAVLDEENRTITLTGGPPIAKQEIGYITGERIVFDMETGDFTCYPEPHIIFELDKDARSKFLE